MRINCPDISRLACIEYSGLIDDQAEKRIMLQIESQIALGRRGVLLKLKSAGGKSQVGINLHKTLMDTGLELWTYNMESVGSAALSVYLAGKTRLVAPSASFFIHPHRINQEEFFSKNRVRLNRGMLCILEACENIQTKKHQEVFRSRTGQSTKASHSLFASENKIGANKALSLGIAHRISELS